MVNIRVTVSGPEDTDPEEPEWEEPRPAVNTQVSIEPVADQLRVVLPLVKTLAGVAVRSTLLAGAATVTVTEEASVVTPLVQVMVYVVVTAGVRASEPATPT